MNKPRTARPPAPAAGAGFTLVELLLVLTLVALLASLLFPAVQAMVQKADSLSCQNNLRQLGVAVQNAAQDNNNIYPYIEPAPPPYEKPVYEPDGTIQARSLLDTLSKYGVTPKTVQCRADVKTLSGDSAAFYAKTPDKYCSYLWKPYVDGEPTGAAHIYTRGGGTFTPKPSKLQLITDAALVHRQLQGQNVLFADGHVAELVVRPK